MRSLIVATLCSLPAFGLAADNLIGMSRFRIATNTDVPADTNVEFYTSADQGRSWQRVPDAQVKRPESGRPSFVFAAPKDGSYGFWTRLLPANGSSEPAPRPGDKPEISYLIDTTAPEIALFSSALERTAEGLVLMATWEVQDLHLDATPVQVQASLIDGDKWVDLGPGQPAKGRCRIPVPQERLRLRLRVLDQAGNKSLSPAAIPVVMGSSDVSSPSTPTETSSTTADTAPATSSEQTTATAATGTEPAADATSPKTGTAALPSLDEIEAQVDQQLATKDGKTAQPSATATAPAASVPDKPADPMATITALAPQRLYRWPEPGRAGADEAAILAEADNILSRRAGRLILGDEATVVLAAARSAARSDDLERAARFYAALHDSDLAATALSEEVMLQLRKGLPIRAATLAQQAPPEARSPALLLAQAYTSFAKDPAASWTLLQSLPPDAPCHLEAQILRARCLLALEKPDTEAAQVILRNVARNQGRLGAHAQELIDLLARAR